MQMKLFRLTQEERTDMLAKLVGLEQEMQWEENERKRDAKAHKEEKERIQQEIDRLIDLLGEGAEARATAESVDESGCVTSIRRAK